MGSSFTDFRGKGFWSTDSLLQVWLRVLALHMDNDVYDTGWQHDLRDQWLLMSGVNFNGYTSPALNEFLTEDGRIAVILRVSERAIRSLRDFGQFVPASFSNALGLDPFSVDLPIEWFNRIAGCFTALLRGELQTDASNSPTLPATRLREGWDEIEQPRKAQPA